jgi:hypothetical protein
MNSPLPMAPPALLRHLYDVAVRRALPLHNTAAWLPVPPPPGQGRTVVLGAGKAAGAMAQALATAAQAAAEAEGRGGTKQRQGGGDRSGHGVEGGLGPCAGGDRCRKNKCRPRFITQRW